MPKRTRSRRPSRPRHKTRRYSFSWMAIAVIVIGFAVLRFLPSSPDETINSPHLLLGNPTEATTSVNNPNNFLIVRPQYALSYNRDKGEPNWVSWQLNQNWLGELDRIPFETDTTLPDGWYRVTPDDYTGSGFDRGHMVPAADRDRTEADRQAAFLMTNILPQAPDNNRGPWEKLESYCRDLVKQGKELYIVAGGTGSGGIGERGRQTTIAERIAVPASTWKVVVVLDRPGLGLAGVTTLTRTIAIVVPNRQGIKAQDWRDFRTSIDAVEELTGTDLLSRVPKPIADLIESKIDAG
ncbi:MAG: DNA/RNA non-specific endonuclease [Oculatellaceae cyanobacterium bins.114]|nr:DNA/RNA non-specific endonuclease [Oculatellaceae cyanobacterium bins.114]